MKLKFVAFLVLALSLTACGVGTGSRIPVSYQATPGEEAYLVGSIGVQLAGKYRSRNTYSTLLFRQVGGKERASIQVGLGGAFARTDVHYQDHEAGMRGRAFSLALAPGEYEFFDVEFSYDITYGYVSTHGIFSPEEDFSRRFTLEAGKAYYLGEFLAFGETVFFFGTSAGGTFLHKMNEQRDLPLLLKKFPKLQGKKILPLALDWDIPPYIYADQFPE